MFSLFYDLWKYIFAKTEFHVLILGIDKAGKTVGRFVSYSQTGKNNIMFQLLVVSFLAFWLCKSQLSYGYFVLMCMWTLLEKLKSVYSNLEGLPPDRIVPTVGLNIGRLEISNAKLVFWDLGGQPGLRSIWEKYYEEVHAVVYVIDAACPSRFEDSKSALEKVLRHEDLKGAPLLIVANKQDLV